MNRLDGSLTLDNGLRVRVRLPHRSDAPALRALLARVGLAGDDLVLGRLQRFDPRGRVSLVATVLVGRCEGVVGLGAIERGADDPELLVADEHLAPGVGPALEGALRAHAMTARRAA